MREKKTAFNLLTNILQQSQNFDYWSMTNLCFLLIRSPFRTNPIRNQSISRNVFTLKKLLHTFTMHNKLNFFEENFKTIFGPFPGKGQHKFFIYQLHVFCLLKICWYIFSSLMFTPLGSGSRSAKKYLDLYLEPHEHFWDPGSGSKSA